MGIVRLSRVRGWWMRWRMTGERIWIRIVCQCLAQLILGVVSKRFSINAISDMEHGDNSPAKPSNRILAVQHERCDSSTR